MKNEKICKLLLLIFAILMILFTTFVVIDYSKYNITFSSPFITYILFRTIEFLLPGSIILMLYAILKRKNNN